MSTTIPITFRNLANDYDITQCIPRPFDTLEAVAASSKLAASYATNAGKGEPDRHDFLKAIPAYLKSLPTSTVDALETVRRDAAVALNLPGMAQDVDTLAKAQEKAAKAQAAVDEAEALQGRRIAQIQALEKQREELQSQLAVWEADFDAEISEAENLILEHYGKVIVTAPFERIQMAEVLKRLAPGKLASIRQSIADTEKQLAAAKA